MPIPRPAPQPQPAPAPAPAPNPAPAPEPTTPAPAPPPGEPPGGALAVRNGQPPYHVIALPESELLGLPGGGQLATSYDVTNPANVDYVVNLLGKADRDLADLLNTDLAVVNWAVHRAQKVDPESGELTVWPRTVLVLTNGTMVSAGSLAVARTVLLAAQGRGRGPFRPPLKLRVTQGKGSDGKRPYNVRIV